MAGVRIHHSLHFKQFGPSNQNNEITESRERKGKNNTTFTTER
jgi:hypothetical protein